MDYEKFRKTAEESDAVCFYFSHEECNVCKVLKPKLRSLLEADFPGINFYYVDTMKYRETAGQLNIFAVPTILIWFGGREWFRQSRNLNLDVLAEELKRPYELIFGEK